MQLQSSVFRRRERDLLNGAAPADAPAAAQPGAASSPSPAAPQPVNRYSVTQQQEEENDAIVKALLTEVRTAKRKFSDIGDEVKQQNKLLETLELTFRSARSSLANTMRSLNSTGVNSVKHMWLLFIFVILFFMFIYLLLKFRR